MNLLAIDQSVLVVIDVQGKLAHLMHDKDSLFKNIRGLIQAAHILKIPVLTTEQVPEKIGKTIPELTEVIRETPIVKASFSCCQELKFLQKLKSSKRKQVIVTGIETHVCVFQTVHDLLAAKFAVQVVVDAVSSRTAENKALALGRIHSRGAILTSKEMVVTELIKTSRHPQFKNILSLIK